jgi:hypothetical protein
MLADEVQLTAVDVVRRLTVTLAVPVLDECDVSPGYEAVIEAVPEVVGRNVEVQVATFVVPDNVHVVKDPVTPVALRLTVPVGVVEPEEVTVTVQAEPSLTTTDDVQLTEVVVDCTTTPTVTAIVWVELVMSLLVPPTPFIVRE